MTSKFRSLVAAVALLFGFAAGQSARAIDIVTPAGLNPGDTFRFIFVSSTTVVYTTSNINTLDGTVTSDATGYTYNGQSITWKALASTLSGNARDHVGGYNTNVPVYLVTGTKVANDMTTSNNGLYSGSLLSAVNAQITGTTITTNVLTGTAADGTSSSILGSSGPTFGVNTATNATWLNKDYYSFSAAPFKIYGISDTLTAVAVPEPSTYALAAIATGVMAAMARRRKAHKA